MLERLLCEREGSKLVSAKILVVDDSPTINSTVEWLLSTHGYTVEIARDSLAAMAAIHTFIPDLILPDVRMPHMDGIDLCKTIRSKARYATLPIIMLSGLSDETSIQRALEAGAAGVAIGRNIWQHPDPAGMTRALVSLVHGQATLDRTLQEIGM